MIKNKTLTILFADVQGYTSRTGSQARDDNNLFVQEIRKFVEKHVLDNNGVFVKAMGDGFLATFESPTDAVNCGTKLQKQIEQRNANVLDESHLIRFRIGISTGEVSVDDNNDVYGDAVNIAARIQSFAEPNEVFISDSTYLSMNKTEVKTVDLGPQRFKNVLEEVRVYRVLKHGGTGGAAALPRPTEPARHQPSFPLGYAALAVAAFLVLALGVFYIGRMSAGTAPSS
ncbi:MAG TPA: adenylate/guanylate cyclase domain-containing protein, partial [Abditibacteriaceae bacterium]|nr:adenylate/guanylate cyclase domain-containing protein [Abditibacteriaceae bacterium]